MKELMERMENQGCGEKRALQAHQESEESQDSKGKPVMPASPDRRVKLDLLVHLEHQADQDMMVIPVPPELWDDLDLRATLVLQVRLDHQDLLAHQDWVLKERRDQLVRGAFLA